MKDTGFYVPPSKASRLANVYNLENWGRLNPANQDQDYTKNPHYLSAGAGMVSTLSDYLRFAQMLLNRGT